MSRPVRISKTYIADLAEVLPLRFTEFLADVHPHILAEAAESFPGQRPSSVDAAYDVVEIRGTWTAGECDYFVIAQLRPGGHVDLVTIEFDLDPLPHLDQ